MLTGNLLHPKAHKNTLAKLVFGLCKGYLYKTQMLWFVKTFRTKSTVESAEAKVLL